MAAFGKLIAFLFTMAVVTFIVWMAYRTYPDFRLIFEQLLPSALAAYFVAAVWALAQILTRRN